MSEDEARKVAGQDEQTDEDVEAHSRKAGATDDGGENEGDDDFEAHKAMKQ